MDICLMSVDITGEKNLIPDGLFKGSIQNQINTRKKNLDQLMFKLNTLKTTEITNIFTAMQHDRHSTSKMWPHFPEILY